MTIRTRNNYEENHFLNNIGVAYKQIRKKSDLTIESFSEAINLSEKTIGNYENGRNLISIENIIKLYELQSNLFPSHEDQYTLTELLDILIVQPYEKTTK